MMKTALLISFLFSGFCFSQMKSISFSELELHQKSNPKPIIIHIYTDWCSVCKIESFNLNKDKDLVKTINENFHFINFEAEKTKEKINFQGKEFKYLSNGNSGIHELVLELSKNKTQPIYPLWIILDEKQNLVNYHEGMLKPNQLRELIKN